jgi:hypothetical protein
MNSGRKHIQEIISSKKYIRKIISCRKYIPEMISSKKHIRKMNSVRNYIRKMVPAMFSRMPKTMNRVYNQKCQHRAGEPHSLKSHMLQNLSSYLQVRLHIYNTIILSQLIGGTDWLGSVEDGFPFKCSQYLHPQFTQATRKERRTPRSH